MDLETQYLLAVAAELSAAMLVKLFTTMLAKPTAVILSTTIISLTILSATELALSVIMLVSLSVVMP